jgi:hypothetical protein
MPRWGLLGLVQNKSFPLLRTCLNRIQWSVCTFESTSYLLQLVLVDSIRTIGHITWYIEPPKRMHRHETRVYSGMYKGNTQLRHAKAYNRFTPWETRDKGGHA